jgi:hypothetical protein
MQKQHFYARARVLVAAAVLSVSFPSCAPHQESLRRGDPKAETAMRRPLRAQAPKPVDSEPDEVDSMISDVQNEAAPLEVRVASAVKLGAKGDQRAGSALLGELSGPEPKLRDAAALALGDLRYMPAAFRLLRMLKDQAGPSRWNAAVALGKIKHRESVPRNHRPRWSKGSKTAPRRCGPMRPAPSGSSRTRMRCPRCSICTGILSGTPGPRPGKLLKR